MAQRGRGLPPGTGGVGRSGRKAWAVERLAQVGLGAPTAARRPSGLSGGEKQRVAIARAMAARPAIVICDEAVSALDVTVRAAILNLLKDIVAESGISLFFIAHDISVVSTIADTTAVMFEGSIVELGPTREVIDNPDIRTPGDSSTPSPAAAGPGPHQRFRSTCPLRPSGRHYQGGNLETNRPPRPPLLRHRRCAFRDPGRVRQQLAEIQSVDRRYHRRHRQRRDLDRGHVWWRRLQLQLQRHGLDRERYLSDEPGPGERELGRDYSYLYLIYDRLLNFNPQSVRSSWAWPRNGASAAPTI